MSGFSAFKDSIVLPEEIAAKVAKHAMARLRQKRVRELICPTPNIGAVTHEDIELGKHIGTGSFASVFEIKSIKSSHKFPSGARHLAVKVLSPTFAAKPSYMAAHGADLYKEALIVSSLNHMNIVKLHAWEASGVYSYVSGRFDAFFQVVDRVDKTLREKLEQWNEDKKWVQRNQMDRREKVRQRRDALRLQVFKEPLNAVMQLSWAVKYLHRKRVLHRDLKPETIGFQNGVLKVADFEVACVLPKSSRDDEAFKLTKAGTPRYMAPEVANKEAYNLSADVYTFTLLAHEVLTLKKPYEELASGNFEEAVYVEGFRPEIPSAWPQGLQKLFRSGWSPEPSHRPKMSDLEEDLNTQLIFWLQEEIANQNALAGCLHQAKKASVATTTSTA